MKTVVAMVVAAIFVAGCSSFRAAQLYQSGTEALDRGDLLVAVKDLQEASRLEPEASEIQNHLGLAYAAAGNDAEALQSFERAVALDCENEAAQRNLSGAKEFREAKKP